MIPIFPDLTFGAITYTEGKFTVEVKNIGEGVAATKTSDAIVLFGTWLDATGKEVEMPATSVAAGFEPIAGKSSLTKTFEESQKEHNHSHEHSHKHKHECNCKDDECDCSDKENCECKEED